MTPRSDAWSTTLDIDRALVDIEREIDVLLNMTPTNVEEAWAEFGDGGFTAPPRFRTRPLSFDPDLVKRRLFNLPVEHVEDEDLAHLFREKRDELLRQVMLLQDRGSERFVYGSLQLFGGIDDGLMAIADDVLARVDADVPPDSAIAAPAFADRARRELQSYRRRYPGFGAGLEIRADIPDVMVSHGRLLIGASTRFRSRRVEALIQHEVGTHVVTFENGAAQPLQLFSVGLPHYDELQEGLAMLSEFLTGGLDPLRLRLIAARVVAVARVLDGAGFVDLFEEMHIKHGFAPKVAWSLTVRTARGGGSTKDVIYLRGIVRLLELLSGGASLDNLLIGKLSFEHIPVVETLLARGVLEPMAVPPRWLELPGAAAKLERVAGGMSLLDLLD